MEVTSHPGTRENSSCGGVLACVWLHASMHACKCVCGVGESVYACMHVIEGGCQPFPAARCFCNVTW